MTLNLITPLLRPEKLQKIYDSIPKHEDIFWIIACAETFELPSFMFGVLQNDPRVGILPVNVKEGLAAVHIKMHAAYKHCKYGFVQGIDDDTIFNTETYEIFQRYKNSHKLIIGKQDIWFEDKFVTRCEAQEPEPGKVDGAQALIHTDILKHIQIKDLSKDPCADGNFLKECWNFCKPEERIIINETISKYNTLR